MIKVTEEQLQYLKNYIANIEELITNNDLQLLLDSIDDIIIYNLDENDEPDEIGIKLQRIYDQIYNQN